MPRSARLAIPNVPMHILQRGHNRHACFVEANDFGFYLSLLKQFSLEHGCQLHAYVLMTNHFHLLATPERTDSASEMMRSVNQRYVQSINRRLGRTGSLWEGRFRSSLVDSESYLFICHRYIEMNPVRARMVAFPGQYPWSSHRANAEGAPSCLLTAHPLFRDLGRDPAERQKQYRSMFNTPLSLLQLEAVRRAIKSDRPLGGKGFVNRVGRLAGKSLDPPEMGRPRKLGLGGRRSSSASIESRGDQK